MEAICARCGASKRAARKKCAGCGLDPAKDDAVLVKSVYLSIGRFDVPDEQERYRAELARMAEALKSGSAIAFDPAELERLDQQRRAVNEVSWRTIGGTLIVFFLPALVALAVTWGALLVLKLLR
jgi:hypothetical protein